LVSGLLQAVGRLGKVNLSTMNVPRLVTSLRHTMPSSSLIQVRHSSGLPVGKRQIEQAKNWASSLAVFGAVGGGVLVYFTDWRVVTDFIPFYNGKYKQDD